MSNDVSEHDDEVDELDEQQSGDREHEAESSTDDDTLATESVPQPASTPLAPPESVTPCEQRSIFAGLASTLPVDGSLLLAITRLPSDELLVTIQPAAFRNESATSVRPMQLVAPIDAMADRLLEALAHYTPARQYVIASAEQIARETAAAAAASAAKAAAKKPSTPDLPPKPKVQTERLLVNIEPSTATITVTDAAGATHAVARGRRADLPVGTYTITATADHCRPAEPRVVELAKDHPQKIDITLQSDAPSLLDGF